MDVIDAHMHINFECNSIHYGNKKIDDYILEGEDISFFIPSINPKAIFFTCDKDCSNNCFIHENDNGIVCPVDCLYRDRHRVKVLDGLNGCLIAYCTKCNKVIYEGKDPFRKYNIQLIELCKKINCAIPNLVLSLSNSTINEEIKFYENNFSNYFLGYKLHPTANFRDINEIKGINSCRTILIHNDSHGYDSIDNAIGFARSYDGNVVLAHSYLLCNVNDSIGRIDNLFFDICPVDNFKKSRKLIAHNNNFDECYNMYDAALKFLNENKILFGTDWPYGCIIENIRELYASSADEKVKQRILSLNAKNAYHI